MSPFRSRSATTPREAVRGSRYVVFMVAMATQILNALFDDMAGAILELPRNATVVLCSTGSPDHVPHIRKLLDETYHRTDVNLVDAPVSGGVVRAAEGTLTILASGPPASLVAAKPVLDAMAGQNLYILQGGLGAGTKAKMVHQVLAGIHIAMASEAMGFAAALGLNTRQSFEYLKNSEASNHDHTIFSALNIIVKDIGIVTAGGRAEKFPLFMTSSTERVMATGVSADNGLENDSNLIKVYLPKIPDLVFTQGSALPTSTDDLKIKLVTQAMAGLHLAAAAEAMSLGVKVGLDTEQLYEIISSAAGTSWIFLDRVPQILSGKWESKKAVEEVATELTESIEEANRMKYPLHLAGTALQLFQLAVLRGYGKQADVAISRIWDGVDGSLFPCSS
ncbi:hypothetical protein OIDMADRAFT_45668 [Oidiodendron maius Zn]|uniref:3-hydroxyisobutyrate dehydrogenase-like NAD-binding domain-containing protein n=1 Tax=Oidiodendron maius (strain Zn) TaxID=913774 RepID=A0A0C3GWU0_OIDMZ|nr:hypothetical protein OIDMADRAFT_45668 [Oidiodendron maius Zn]